MVLKKLAAAWALVAFATPTVAFDVREAGASTTFYISIPLDHRLSRKEQQWTAGLLLQGKRDYRAINIDSRMLSFLQTGDVEPRWIIAGLVAAGAAMAIGKKNKETAAEINQQQQSAPQQPCPKPVVEDPCSR